MNDQQEEGIKLKEPKAWVSWLLGLFLPILLIGALYLNTLIVQAPLSELHAILIVLIVGLWIVFGEIIQNHRKLIMTNMKLDEVMERLQEFDVDEPEENLKQPVSASQL